MVILSIVIANYNYGRFLPEAIESVLSQATPEIELIVIDGGSTDESVEVIKRYAEERGGGGGDRRRVDGLGCETGGGDRRRVDGSTLAYWVSEPDHGQSDAFNKGFARARGKYLTWLNADDILAPGAVAAILKQLKAHPDCEWFTGNAYRFHNDTGRVIEIVWGPHVYPKWMQSRRSPIVVFGPSSIFAKGLWDRMGRIDEQMHLMMDSDLWMRFIVAGIKQRRINHLIWCFRMHEDSKTAEFGDHKLDEKRLQMFARERERSRKKTGYRSSLFWRYAILALRVLDGSLLRRYHYMITLRKIDWRLV